MDKPDLIEVVRLYIELRKSGREYIGLALCHSDHHPSGRYNQEKQKWFCDPCGRGGDVIDFIMLAENVSFKKACAILGIDNTHRLRPSLTPARKRAAYLAANWARQQRGKFNLLLTDAVEQRDLADELGDSDLAELFEREITVLRAFHESLEHPSGAAEMLGARASIERITLDVEIVDEPPAPFPALTSEYLAILKEAVGPSSGVSK
jgi:hypothetical protein